MELKKNKFNITLQYDPIYYNKLINKLIYFLIKNGKKSLAFKIIYKMLNKIKYKTNKNPIYIFYQAIKKNEIYLLQNLTKKNLFELKLNKRKKLFIFLLNSFKIINLNEKNFNKKNKIFQLSFKLFYLSKQKIK